MRLRVKANVGPHFKGGAKYSPGEEFDGTERELKSFSDKLEEVESPKVYVQENIPDDTQLKVSIPSGKSKRGRPKKRPNNESYGQPSNNVD